jgi:hypothetical protein
MNIFDWGGGNEISVLVMSGGVGGGVIVLW